MAKVSHANRIARAYAQNEIAEAKLIALGVPERKIYRAWKGQTLDRVSLRSGELLGVIGGLRGLIDGDSKKEIVKAIDRVHDQGATVIDLETGYESRKDGVKMMHLAFAPKGPEPDVAREMQAKAAKKRRGGQMPEADAERIWDDPRYKTRGHALEAMGWRSATAGKVFGPRYSRATRHRPWAKKS